MLLELIDEIKFAMEKKSYLSALYLALSIPDICGKIYCPDLQNKNGAVEKRYAVWYDEHIYNTDHSPTGPKVNYLNGYFMYGLRNALVHDGDVDINQGIQSAIKNSQKIKNDNNEKFNNIDTNIKSIKLTLKYPDEATYGVSRINHSNLNSEGHVEMEMDIAHIVIKLISTAEVFYMKYETAFKEKESNKNWIVHLKT